jgi:ubiquinone/menaquinone biosynthesis C-methylase UbiE
VFDPIKRFSTRVENYVKYRPSYPPAIISLLESECGLTSDTIIADMGFGTGLLTELFLKHGNSVVGIEPNAEMRAAGEGALAKYANFQSIDATAEATTLSDNSVDMIVAGQAFHWFDRAKVRAEFQRILKLEGWVVLIWNGFHAETSALNNGYQDIVMRYGTDYKEVAREITGLDVEPFFAPNRYKLARFAFKQYFDFAGLRGRLLSSSYAPNADDPGFDNMISDLRALFEANQRHGQVQFDYQTEVYYGRLPAL